MTKNVWVGENSMQKWQGLIKCKTGHVYNANKYGSTCPNCGAPPEDSIVAPVEESTPAVFESEEYASGFLACTKGCNRGTIYTIRNRINTVGSDPNMSIYIKGDSHIDKENHMVLFYDNHSGAVYLNGKSSLGMVYVDHRAVYDTTTLENLQTLQLGDTHLNFVKFCDGGFTWEQIGNTNM